MPLDFFGYGYYIPEIVNEQGQDGNQAFYEWVKTPKYIQGHYYSISMVIVVLV